MWVGLAASRTLPTFTTDAPDDGMKSIIDHLQAVLKEYSSDLNAVRRRTPNPLQNICISVALGQVFKSSVCVCFCAVPPETPATPALHRDPCSPGTGTRHSELTVLGPAVKAQLVKWCVF